jgi:hypothetical protein
MAMALGMGANQEIGEPRKNAGLFLGAPFRKFPAHSSGPRVLDLLFSCTLFISAHQ